MNHKCRFGRPQSKWCLLPLGSRRMHPFNKKEDSQELFTCYPEMCLNSPLCFSLSHIEIADSSRISSPNLPKDWFQFLAEASRKYPLMPWIKEFFKCNNRSWMPYRSCLQQGSCLALIFRGFLVWDWCGGRDFRIGPMLRGGFLPSVIATAYRSCKSLLASQRRSHLVQLRFPYCLAE